MMELPSFKFQTLDLVFKRLMPAILSIIYIKETHGMGLKNESIFVLRLLFYSQIFQKQNFMQLFFLNLLFINFILTKVARYHANISKPQGIPINKISL